MSSRTPQELAPRIWDAWRGARLEMLTTPPSQAERQLDALIKELLQSVRDIPSPAAAEDDDDRSVAGLVAALEEAIELAKAVYDDSAWTVSAEDIELWESALAAHRNANASQERPHAD